jgi:Uma2 family endonuclease
MANMLEDKVWTAEDLLALDEPGYVHEIVRGELRRMTGPGYWHGAIAMRLGLRVGSFVEQHRLGMTYAAETGFLLESGPDTVRCPDVGFVRAERVPEQWTRGHLRGAPDLVAEVASPNDTYAYLHDKALFWLEHGARLVWVVEPEAARVSVYRPGGTVHVLQGDAALSGDDVLPGFTLPLAELFAPPR